MPDPREGETRREWLERCIPVVLEDGTAKDNDQAVAICASKWEEYMSEKSITKATMKKEQDGEHPASHYLVVEDSESPTTWHLRVRNVEGDIDHRLMGAAWAALHGGYRGNKYEGPDKETAIGKLTRLYEAEGMDVPKALYLPMVLTKADRMADGRIRWQARANTGEFDLEDERFDTSFWGDVTRNFYRVQEALSKGEQAPEGMPAPILDIAHYSLRLPSEKRSMARAGWPFKVWVDGTCLMAQGYFDDSPLGNLAAKAAMERPPQERRVSIGVWPDWGRVELVDGKRVYKGGRDRAYLDHLALTAHPVDPGTILEVKAMDQKTDALDVLGDSDEAKAAIDELEAAKMKAIPDGVLTKTDAEEVEDETPVEEPETEVVEAEDELEPEAEKALTAAELQEVLKGLFAAFGDQLNQRLAPLEGLPAEIKNLNARMEALGATESEKVKAAVDSGGVWWDELVRNSVQRKTAVEGGATKGPAEAPAGDFASMFGNT